MSYQKVKVACFDLDGTLRRSKTGNFIKEVNDIELFDGVKERLQKLKDEGFLIFGITNQAGVAHGFKGIEQVQEENFETERLLESMFSYIVFAPCDPKGNIPPFNSKTLLRKPNIGMFAIVEHYCLINKQIVDWDNSFYVGDRPEDMSAAKLAGINFIAASIFRMMDMDLVSNTTKDERNDIH